jgi:hypothetical protein
VKRHAGLKLAKEPAEQKKQHTPRMKKFSAAKKKAS